MCLQHQAWLTACDALQRNRMRSYHRRACSWSRLSDQLCPLSALTSSAQCKSVRKPHANLRDSPVALTSASNYFQMLPGLSGALHCALRLCKSILRCSWMYLQLWRCIQDATRLTNRIVKVWSCWDLCAGLQETSRAAETSAQVYIRHREQLRPLRRLGGRLGGIFTQQQFRGAVAAAGFMCVLQFFHFCSVGTIFQISLRSGDEGSRSRSSDI